jgi:hypothetical protein
MSNIIISSEEELKQALLELAHAGNNMRHAQKYWHLHFGGQAKQRKEYWEKKFDGVLNRLGLSEHQNLSAIKIIKQ